MPAGFEFSEGVNGVASVRRVDNVPKLVANSDAELVRAPDKIPTRGEGGWSYALAHGTMSNLVRNFVRHVETQQFFDLW